MLSRFLSQLLAGEEPTQMRPASAAKVLQMLDKLTAAVGSGAFKSAISSLMNTDLSSIKQLQVVVFSSIYILKFCTIQK